jgi:hypothetical protein
MDLKHILAPTSPSDALGVGAANEYSGSHNNPDDVRPDKVASAAASVSYKTAYKEARSLRFSSGNGRSR